MTSASKPRSSDVPDVLAPNLRIVFCGINPGRMSAAAAAHFANPRNDFWRLLHAAKLTPRLFAPSEQFELLDLGIGVTNAAARTTPGSGDLRKSDFDRSHIERVANELRPRWVGFVGKEAYRGVFGERPELGAQARRLAETELFVLPSTSPANAAVPWSERLRWFRELAGRAAGTPKRQSVRALLLDDVGRTLLVRYGDDYGMWWVTPGGGQEPAETDEQTLRRELAEECGLDEVVIGGLLWTDDGFSLEEPGHGGWSHRVYLVRVPSFEPAPRVEMATEGAHEMRWFSADELDGLPTRPEDLAAKVRNLV